MTSPYYFHPPVQHSLEICSNANSTMQSSSRGDQAFLASNFQAQATCSEDFMESPTDSMEDLWRQMDRTTLRPNRPIALSSAHFSRLQAADSPGSSNAISNAGNAMGHLREELQNTSRCQSTPNSLIGISAALDDIILGKNLHSQLDSPTQQSNTCIESSDYNSIVSTLAFSAGSMRTPLSLLAKQQGGNRSRTLRDHRLDEFIDALPDGTDKELAGRQNTVYKRIRIRRAWKKNLRKSRKRFNA